MLPILSGFTLPTDSGMSSYKYLLQLFNVITYSVKKIMKYFVNISWPTFQSLICHTNATSLSLVIKHILVI